MAFSLVKDEGVENRGLPLTTAIWREIRTWLDAVYPDAVIVSEGNEPRTNQKLAFDGDFFLVIMEEHASLFDNHGAGVLPFQAPQEPFFGAEGLGSLRPFLDGWGAVKSADPDRLVIMSTADHDFDRLRCGLRTPEQLGAALTFLLTWGSVPCIYYGDEIGMRYLPDMPNIEGAICNPTYNRVGCRTPMQWDDSLNAGFSSADPSDLYLPIDPDPGRPTIAAQEQDAGSTLGLTRALIATRKAIPALGARASTRVLHEGYPFAYLRNETHFVVVNPRREQATFVSNQISGAEPVIGNGVSIAYDTVTVEGFGYGIFTLPGKPAHFLTEHPGRQARTAGVVNVGNVS